MTSRSPAAVKAIMPPMENRASGKTSLVPQPARDAARSSGDPGTAAPIGVKASAPAEENFSAIRSTEINDSTRIEPCRKSAGPSMMTPPLIVAPC